MRVAALAVALGLVAFVAGLRVRQLDDHSTVHPITGRQIAGIATDASWLDRRTRTEEESPDEALRLIGVPPRSVVADVGAGSGYMTTRLSALVGPEGRVFANDIQPAMLQVLRSKIETQHLDNVVIVQGTETDARLPANAIDLELLVDVYHEFSHPQEMLRSLRGSLKADGRLVLVEYRQEDPTLPIAPTHRMSVDGVRAEVQAEQFTLDRVIEDLPRQHIIEFRR
jgi:ubiquinone/menaquinone biosynthesis C-methylase UbiE